MSNLDLRYQRLGHPTDKIVKIILNQCKRKFSNNEIFSFYIAYQLGKSQKLLFPTSNFAHNTPLEFVHLNVWGPALTLSSNGFQYYVRFINVYSRFTWLYFLKAKSEVYSTFHNFKTQAKLHPNCKLKTLRTN